MFGRHSIIRFIAKIIALISTAAFALFLHRLMTSSVLPAKYFYIVLAALAVADLVYFVMAFSRHSSRILLILFGGVMLIVSGALFVATIKINELFDFLNKNFDGNNKQVAVYNLIVSDTSSFNNIDDLKDRRITALRETEPEVAESRLVSMVDNKIPGATLRFREDLKEVMETALKDTTSAILVNHGVYGSYLESDSEYEGKVKILASFEFELDGQAVEPTKQDLTNSPFVLYISGIDTRTGKMPSRSLSDVNIIAAVNPETRHILLVTTPRDAYVQLHGTTGLKDKLTHAGSRGGVKLSQATLEDLYGIEIDRYIRVNFVFVQKLVDAIGGITVNSDVDYVVTTRSGKCEIYPGNNDVDGKCALGFARERKSYKDGDNHRGRNQMQVIEKVIDKVTSGRNILDNYEEILKALEGTFDTNISTNDITSMVRAQLDKMKSWKVESYSITGRGELTKTYSYPNQNLYVLHINVNTLNTAKEKIKAVLDE